MAPGRRRVHGITPVDLGEAGKRVAEVRHIERPCRVMVGKPAERSALRRGFDHRKGRIWQLPDVRSTPRRSRGVGRSQRQEEHRYANRQQGRSTLQPMRDRG